MFSTILHRRSVWVAARLLFVAVLLLISAARATADAVFYDNGPPLTSENVPDAGAIAPGSVAASESFTVSTATSLTGAQFALWVDVGYLFGGSPTWSVDWSIGSAAFDNTYGSGTASLTSTSLGTVSNGYTLFEESFSLSSPSPLAPGTYWLSLSNLTNLLNGWNNIDFLAESVSPPVGSQAYWESSGNPPVAAPVASFQLSTPEPSSVTLLCSALFGFGAFYLRRRRAKA